jgi:excisionase family DNA binding protein
MDMLEKIERPTKREQKLAFESYGTLAAAIAQMHTEEAEIEIEETGDKIRIPLRALKLLGNVLDAMSKGKPISLVPMAAEVTTQKAAEILGCSRPHLVKLLEDGKLPFTKVGKHRRVRFEDLMQYKKGLKEGQRQHLIDIMRADEETGLYDS